MKAYRSHRDMNQGGHKESCGEDRHPGNGLIVYLLKSDGGSHGGQGGARAQHRGAEHSFRNMHDGPLEIYDAWEAKRSAP